jgi:hypothetical protein
MKRAVPYLLASIIHAEAKLRENLQDVHPLFKQPIFRYEWETSIGTGSVVSLFRTRILTGVNYCSETNVSATGVPQTVSILAKTVDVINGIEGIITKMQHVEESMMNSLDEAKKKTEEIVDELPDLLYNKIRNQLAARHQTPTVTEVQMIVSRETDALRNHMTEQIKQVTDQYQALQNLIANMQNGNGVQRQRETLPHDIDAENEQLPNLIDKLQTYNTITTFHLWYFESEGGRIRPLKNIPRSNFTRPVQCIIAKISIVMSNLERIGVYEHKLERGKDFSSLETVEAINAFKYCFQILATKIYATAKKKTTPSLKQITTIADKTYQYLKNHRGDILA